MDWWLENTTKNIIRDQLSVIFNETCVEENMLSKYTKFKHHDPALYNNSKTIEYKKHIIERGINTKKMLYIH